MTDVSFFERVYAVVRRIPHGQVATYGDVALYAGSPGAARITGYALRALGPDSDVPWWRVINRDGGISWRVGPGPEVQRRLLEEEGIAFNPAGLLDLTRYRYDGAGASGFGGQP